MSIDGAHEMQSLLQFLQAPPELTVLGGHEARHWPLYRTNKLLAHFKQVLAVGPQDSQAASHGRHTLPDLKVRAGHVE